MTLIIKNMVCDRCISAVENILIQENLSLASIELGKVVLAEGLETEKLDKLSSKLISAGFELVDNKKKQKIVDIKKEIIELVHKRDSQLDCKLSDYLEKRLDTDYNILSSLFSEVEGQSIEKYFINQKIEKVKELLVYGELSLSEISYKLNYSSVAHLSGQFKKVTGLTPSHFKKIGAERRMGLDQV